MDIYVKSAWDSAQLFVRDKIDCTGVEVQLLDEFLSPMSLPNLTWKPSVQILVEHNVKVIHAPLLNKLGLSLDLEQICNGDSLYSDIWFRTFRLADEVGDILNRKITIVVHMSKCYKDLVDLGLNETFIAKLADILTVFQYVEIAIEILPMINIDLSGTLSYRNSGYNDVCETVKILRDKLQTDRIGVCLDVYHAMITANTMKGIRSKLQEEKKAPMDYSLESHFKACSGICKLIHLADFKGSGYGAGYHAIPFTKETDYKLRQILDLYHEYEYNCPITIEVTEKDYLEPQGFISNALMIKEVEER